MKLDRNESSDGSGKYALINMREIRRIGGVAKNPDIAAALRILDLNGLLNYGNTGSDGEFFMPIRLTPTGDEIWNIEH